LSLLVGRVATLAFSVTVAFVLLFPLGALPQSMPDLVVKDLIIIDPPASALPGIGFAVTVTVKNKGLATAAPSTTRFFLLSTSGPVKISLKGVQAVPSLAHMSKEESTVMVAVRPETIPDEYLFFACADALGNNDETIEVNNCKPATEHIIVPPTPDLVVTSITDPPASVEQGQGFDVTNTVKNVGAEQAGPSTTRYYLVSTSSDVKKSLKGSQDVPALDPDQTFNEDNKVDIPIPVKVTVKSETDPGEYKLLACADALNAISERSEKENCLPSDGSIVVIALPDLVVKSVAVDQLSVVRGESLVVTVALANEGHADAGASKTKFMLVNTVGATTKNLKGTQLISGVGSLTTNTTPTTVGTHFDTPIGTYKVRACADSTKAVRENAEGNNCTDSTDVVTVR
jgi:subtilase family serine protease